MSDRAHILAPGRALAEAIEGYEDRPGQRRLADAIGEALEGQRPLLAEAGTGTGKTLAYLAPAARSGKRVVISTGTRALQDQIAAEDLPTLERALGRPVNAATLKGVSNYLCLRRYRRALAGAGAGAGRAAALARVAAWAGRTEDGDAARDLDIAESDPVWPLITTDAEGRLGPRCPHYDACFVTRARRRADEAELIFVSHHLFVADLALQSEGAGAGILPRYDAVIFDEAHQLEDVLTEHFGVAIGSGALSRLSRDVREHAGALADSVADERAAVALAAELEDASEALWRAARAFAAPAGPLSSGRAGSARAEPRRAEIDPARFGERAEAELGAAQDALAAIAARAARRAGEDDSETAHESAEIADSLARRAGRHRRALDLLSREPVEGYAYWAETRADRVRLGASPIDVSEVLRERLVPVTPAVVLTSATLRAGGDFRYTRERLGLEEDLADDVAVPSPFDFASQALLYVPRDLPEPGDGGFARACAARLAELATITGGRALGLFTSHRALREAAAELRARSPLPCLVQGEAPRARILNEFRDAPEAIVCATGSFWEGIDLPGDTLSLVVIDKIPFASPADPMAAARIRALERRGVDPFRAYQIPRAALALKQGFGRLIRRRGDRGIAAVLDRRLVTRSYGRALVGALPDDLPRTSHIERVRAWWRSGT